MQFKTVGKSVEKIDSLALACGEEKFTDDFQLDNPLHIKILHSPYAHAIIEEIDASEALKIEGVLKVYTYKDIKPILYSSAGQGFPEPSPYDSLLLDKRVRYVGDNVAFIVAESEEIADMAEDRGGFVVNSNLYKTTTSSGAEVPTANITIRVPVEDLDMTLEKIKGLVEDPDIDILSEDISGQDVTKEVTDLESRLRNLEAAEEQLLEIMEDATETEKPPQLPGTDRPLEPVLLGDVMARRKQHRLLLRLQFVACERVVTGDSVDGIAPELHADELLLLRQENVHGVPPRTELALRRGNVVAFVLYLDE